jgi:hypothetical protein
MAIIGRNDLGLLVELVAGLRLEEFRTWQNSLKISSSKCPLTASWPHRSAHWQRVAPFQNWPLWSGDSSTLRLLPVSKWFASSLTLRPWRRGEMLLRNDNWLLLGYSAWCGHVVGLYMLKKEIVFFTEEMWTWVLKFVLYMRYREVLTELNCLGISFCGGIL